ncbi:hypothetical protein HN953_00010 [Candidatus Woesearchaeota archaeon]|jgi:hypothetical protein|nr:hypothetical protein [Candidatus Woesearchaeota archaeon]
MRGVYLIFIFVVISLVISGCERRDIKTNLGGIDMQILEGTPPRNEIYEGQAFSVNLKLINNMPREVNDVSLCVYDTPSESIGGIPGKECKTINFFGAQEYEDEITPEISEVLIFPESGGYVYQGIHEGIKVTSIFTELEYSTNSKSVIYPVCFKKGPEIETDFFCELKESFSGSKINSDFAPINVQRVEKNIVPLGQGSNQVVLDIFLVRDSQGEVVSELYGGQNLMDVKVSVGKSGDYFECAPSTQEGLIEFKEGTKKITCINQMNLEENAYQDSINIDLMYGYKVVQPIRNIQLKEGIIR